jgi:hypothetical protein
LPPANSAAYYLQNTKIKFCSNFAFIALYWLIFQVPPMQPVLDHLVRMAPATPGISLLNLKTWTKEEEGSVQLTFRYLSSSALFILKTFVYLCHKTSYHNEEVNCTNYSAYEQCTFMKCKNKLMEGSSEEVSVAIKNTAKMIWL